MANAASVKRTAASVEAGIAQRNSIRNHANKFPGFIFACNTVPDSPLYKYALDNEDKIMIGVAVDAIGKTVPNKVAIYVPEDRVLTIMGFDRGDALCPAAALMNVNGGMLHFELTDNKYHICTTPVGSAVHSSWKEKRDDKDRKGRKYVKNVGTWFAYHFPEESVPTQDDLRSGVWEQKMRDAEVKQKLFDAHWKWFFERDLLVWDLRQLGGRTSQVVFHFYKKGIPTESFMEDIMEGAFEVSALTPLTMVESLVVAEIDKAVKLGELTAEFRDGLAILYRLSTTAVNLRAEGIMRGC